MARLGKYGLQGFLCLSHNSEEYRNILNLVRGVIVQCFDLNLSAGKQSQESWDSFWEEIQTVFPTRNDPDRVSTLRNHVHRYIRDVRCHRRSLPVAVEDQADEVEEYARSSIASPPTIITSMQLRGMSLMTIQQGPMTPSRTASNSMMTLENISIISDEDLTPEYPPPRRCLVPPQPQGYQAYEICIVAADSALRRVKCPAFAPSDGMNGCDPSTPSPPFEHPSPSPPNVYDCDSTQGESTEGHASDTGPICGEAEFQVPASHSESPDVYNFLRSCVPEMTHLLPLFVDDLGIKNAKSLSAIVKWPPQSQNQYFLNMIRDGKLNIIESEVIKRRLCEM